MKNTLLILFLMICVSSIAQTSKNPGFGGSMGKQEICSQLGFSDDAEVNNMVDKILDYAGVVNHSYEVRGCSNATGCFATVINNKQYIIYQPDYLKTIKTYGFSSASLPTEDKDWQALTILAHEVGHLINSHFYECPQDLTVWNKELQADEFAGKIIYHLGGTLDQAQSVYNTSIVPEEGGMTHPPRKERLAAVKKGYEKGQRLFPRPAIHFNETIRNAPNVENKNEMTTVDNPDNVKVHLPYDDTWCTKKKYHKDKFQFYGFADNATNGGDMIRVNCWYIPADRRLAIVCEGEYQETQLSNWGWTDKRTVFFACRTPGPGRIAFYGWYNPVTRGHLTVSGTEFSDDEMLNMGFTQKHLQFYALESAASKTVTVNRWLLGGIKNGGILIPEQ